MTSIASPSAVEHRTQMVQRIADRGVFRSTAVQQAMIQVPRHRFVPAASLETAYGDRSVTTKEGGGPLPLSCASEPQIVAMMLEQLDVEPGHRVLEIGAGTGYNAALLAELVGPSGQVTTIDVYPDVVEGARAALADTGYGRVQVVQGDGGEGHPEGAPYDRVIVTVGPWDLPPAWLAQLAIGGRLVVPLRWRGQARAVAFVREADGLRSVSVELCGFIPMTGPGQEGEHSDTLDPEGHVRLVWDADQAVDVVSLREAFAAASFTAWSGVTIASGAPFDGIWLRLTATDRGTCRLSASALAIESGRCKPAVPSRSPALVEGASLAYLTVRRLGDSSERRFELGATGHGPDGAALASRLCGAVQAWSPDRAAQPLIEAVPRTAGLETQGIPKPNIDLVITYPEG